VSTDKDGLIPAFARGRNDLRAKARSPSQIYRGLTDALGEPFAIRVDAKATPAQKALLGKLSPEQVTSTELAGERIQQILSHAPGNNQAIGGLKVMTKRLFAARHRAPRTSTRSTPRASSVKITSSNWCKRRRYWLTVQSALADTPQSI